MTPRPKSNRKSVQVRFDPDTADDLYTVAEREGWTWDHGSGPFPSRSEAVRRLVTEALTARKATTPDAVNEPSVAISEAGWAHAQRWAETLDEDPHEVVRRMLSYAARAMKLADYQP